MNLVKTALYFATFEGAETLQKMTRDQKITLMQECHTEFKKQQPIDTKAIHEGAFMRIIEIVLSSMA